MPYFPPTTALRCLDASARWGSFTRAAHELNLTQSAVSHHILNLERQLGVKLFERQHGGLQLTEPGKTYWQETVAALQLLRRASQRATDPKREHAMLTISAPPSFANAWLMPRLGQFVDGNPDITVNLVNHHGSEHEHGEDDATITLSEGNATDVVSVRLLSLVYCPYASPALLRRYNLFNDLNER